MPETHQLRCYGCGDEYPEDDLNQIEGAGTRSPRLFCDGCEPAAKKGRGY